MRTGKDDRSSYFRVSLTLPRKLDNFLETLSSEARAKGGFKLAKTEIVRALIMAMMELNVNVEGVKDEEELKARIIEAAKK